MNTSVDPRKVYEKYCNGDMITDDELSEALAFFESLAADMRKVGPVFQLSANEAGRVAHGLRGFARSRARR